jgi:putative FmdB family regulatory protein
MPTYEFRCGQGHRFEAIQSFTAPLPACPTCGESTRKVPAAVGMLGRAEVPPSADRMPQTWRGTYEGNREYVHELRRTAETRRRLEERHPELAGDQRPIVAHEGRYEGAPLRAGDPVLGQSRGHGHNHNHGHGHGHGHGQDGGRRDSGNGSNGGGAPSGAE